MRWNKSPDAALATKSLSSIALQASFKLASGHIPYTVQRSARRRSIGLKIDATGLTIILPQRAPLQEAERVIGLKLNWIQAKLAERAARPAASLPPPLHWGGTVWWMGEPRSLQPALRGKLTPETLYLCAANEARIAEALARFYQRSAKSYFAERVAIWSTRMDLHPKQLALSSARSRWGSCTSAGVVRLNWRLMQAPASVIDYVVIHELAHLAEMNHSARFWAIVAAVCPHWKTERHWLKQHGAALLGW
ncbi:M48 family metallopeptidase [Chitinibacter fontanus]|uniref:M48 family metallopeptidase n=1 Tax=Chitinibacter fontanus TaxID=1737446 RepID=A0A7D5V8N6_9NEIS|nr:SprT family zinc-dependent metalloprotease [Chitinibacter fontanus]QLI81037.1 M48 family metallopeptidase [Chitinibacter fontanus]